MTALWQNDGKGWRLIQPAAFPDEATLHRLVEEAPHLLPLAGSPALTIVGREVQLGSGSADLIALESSGRPTVIEIKLARNAEARRAVVAQVLAYAASLRGTDREELERILARHLRERSFSSLTEAVAGGGADGFDEQSFEAALAANLSTGAFRLVFVLDEAPSDLVRLVGYLESLSDLLVIDLVTVTAYDVNGTQIIVPQRVDPEREPLDTQQQIPKTAPRSIYVEGSTEFEESIVEAAEDQRSALRQLCEWARSLEKEGLANLQTTIGSGRWVLNPRLPDENVGLVQLWNDNGASVSFSRSVFERQAPQSIARVEAVIAPLTIGFGNTTRAVTDGLLQALTEAYHEAAGQTTLNG